MDDHDDPYSLRRRMTRSRPSRAASGRRGDDAGGPETDDDGLSTSERLERLRSGLQKSARGETRRASPAGSSSGAQESRRNQRMRDFAADLGALSEGDGAGRSAQPTPARPAAGRPATGRSPARREPPAGESDVDTAFERARGALARGGGRQSGFDDVFDDGDTAYGGGDPVGRSGVMGRAPEDDYADDLHDPNAYDDNTHGRGARGQAARRQGAYDQGAYGQGAYDQDAYDQDAYHDGAHDSGPFAGRPADGSYAPRAADDAGSDPAEDVEAFAARRARRRASRRAPEPPVEPGPDAPNYETDEDGFVIGGWYEEEAPARRPAPASARAAAPARRARRVRDAEPGPAIDDDSPSGDAGGRKRGRRQGGARQGRSAADAKSDRAARSAARVSGGAGAFGALERSIAWRYLRARREEGFISVIAFLSLLGITLGVATLIIVMSVMNGFRAELIDKIVGVNSHITVLPQSRQLEDYERIADTIERIPGVTRAAPVVEAQVFASSPVGGSGAIVRGLRAADMLTLDGVSVEPERSRGSLASFASGRGIAIGEGVARRLGLALGDSVKLISPRGAATPFGVVPRSRSYEVIYVFKTGVFGYDDAMMYMPLDEAQSFFNRPDSVDAVEVTVATPDKLDGYAVDIQAAVDTPITVTDWKQTNSGIIGALKTEATVMFVILSLLILLAALIIISGLVMLVKEKGRGIAILRTMGLSRGAVMRIFFLAGAAIGVVGTIMGVGLGVAFTLNIQEIKAGVELVLGVQLFPENVYGLSSLPARLLVEDVVLTVSVALGVSFLATLYPAWRAARLDPVEALRYE